MSAPRKVHVGDHGGNILQMNDSVNGNWTYTYDGFNRLFTANNSNQQAFSYGYDRFGNRWNQTMTIGSGPQPSYSFTGNNNRMDGYSYDAAGNLLNDGTAGYVYDDENRIVQIVGGASYMYDANGQRVRKSTGRAKRGRPKGDSLNCAIFFLRVQFPTDAETRSLCSARSCQPCDPARRGPSDHLLR